MYPKIDVADLIMRAYAAKHEIQSQGLSKGTSDLFKAKTEYNRIMRELGRYQFNRNDFLEMSVWYPKYTYILRNP